MDILISIGTERYHSELKEKLLLHGGKSAGA